MATISNEQFLFCCIENSNGGSINWTSVAEICYTTKGAAAMRYRRMKEKFGTLSSSTVTGDSSTNENAPDNGDGEIATPKKKGRPKKAATEKSSAKKREMSDFDVDEANGDEETPIKSEVKKDF